MLNLNFKLSILFTIVILSLPISYTFSQCPSQNCDFVIDTDTNHDMSFWITEAFNQGIQLVWTTPPSFPLWPSYWSFVNVNNVCIIGSQNLIINQSVGFDNCTVASDNVLIEVSDDLSALRSFGSTFQGCSGDWPGIQSSARFVGLFAGTVVRDADIGLEVTNTGRAMVVRSAFSDCGTGLDWSGSSNWGLRQNTFTDCTIGLISRSTLFNYPTDNSGAFLQSGGRSTFEDNDQSIVIAGSEANLWGCDVNLNGGYSRHSGIHIQHGSPVQTVFANNMNIWNCRFGIFDNCRTLCRLEDISLENIDRYGISKNQNGSMEYINVDHIGVDLPILAVNTNLSVDVTIRDCEYVGCHPSDDESLVMIGAAGSVLLESNTAFDVRSGMGVFDLQNTSEVVAIGNALNMNTGQFGIGLMGNTGSKFNLNSFNGGESGIHLDGHENTEVCENSFFSLTTGILYEVSPTSEIKRNTFYNTTNGVDISMGGVGPQSHHGNCFVTSSAATDNVQTSEFIYDPADSTPDCPLEAQGATADMFTNESGQTLTECEISAIVSPPGDDTESCEGPDGTYPGPCCTLWDYPDCDYLIDYYGGYNSFSQPSAWAMMQTITAWWNQMVTANGAPGLPMPPGYLDCITVIEMEGSEGEGEFGSLNQDDVVAQAALLSKLELALSYSSGESAELEELNSLINNNKNILSAMSAPVDDEMIVQLTNEISVLYAEIVQIQSDRSARRESLATEVLSEITTLSSSYDFVETQNMVIRLRASHLKSDLSFDNSDWSDLIAAANSCPVEVGQATYDARILYYLEGGGPHPLTYNNNCLQLTERASNNITYNSDYKIHPNPTSNELLLSNKYVGSIAHLSIQNIYGENLMTRENIDLSSSYSIDVSSLSAGTYFMIISGSNDLIHTKRFIKID